MSKPKAVTELLANQDANPLAHAIQRGKKLQQLSRWVRNTLDPELGNHCQVLNLRGKTLILATDATVWATRLRYQIPQLLQALHQHDSLREIVDIQIRVTPINAAPVKKARRRMTLSASSADCLEQCASAIEDKALSSALQRLAGRRKK